MTSLPRSRSRLLLPLFFLACDSGSALRGSGGLPETTDGGPLVEPRPACTAPPVYRNLFVELLGKKSAEVDAKVNTAVQQFFHGGSNQKMYYELGADQAYILDVYNNDVRSEGMSYGMTIAVQMDRKVEFDKLWTYAATCMRQPNNLFAWQMKPGTCTPISRNSAPDGEEYFAMALLLASRRWGDDGPYHYANEAKKVMAAMLAPRPHGEFNADPALVSFGPFVPFSDPSYVLPLFYSEWACFDTVHADFWNKAVVDGRTHFQQVTHPVTGLAPGQSTWGGTPFGTEAAHYNFDAQRVPMNIMADFNLNGADPWQATWAKTMSAFWMKEGLSRYGATYNLDGTGKSGSHGAGITAMNAMLAFALPASEGRPFVQAAWNASLPTGTYRYYEGCLYVLAMLHLSGKFSLHYGETD